VIASSIFLQRFRLVPDREERREKEGGVVKGGKKGRKRKKGKNEKKEGRGSIGVRLT